MSLDAATAESIREWLLDDTREPFPDIIGLLDTIIDQKGTAQ